MLSEPSMGWVRVSGLVFGVGFIVSATVGLGDLLGAFADMGMSFPAYFDERVDRLRHAGGTYLLSGSGLAFVAFTATLARGSLGGDGPASAVAVAFAGVFAALVGAAAAALSTVSLSVGFGAITGDPGIQQAQDLLPQLGNVLLTVPAPLACGVTVWLVATSARRVGVLPTPLVIAGQVTAIAQLFAFYLLPMILLPLWVLTASLGVRSPHNSAGVV